MKIKDSKIERLENELKETKSTKSIVLEFDSKISLRMKEHNVSSLNMEQFFWTTFSQMGFGGYSLFLKE